MKMILTFQQRLSIVLFVLSTFLLACSDSEDEQPPVNEDGFYVYGSSTVAASAADDAGLMEKAVLDHKKGAFVQSMNGVYGKFIFIGANSTISFSEVKDKTEKKFGATDGGTVANGSDVDNVLIDDEVIHGVLTENADPVEILNEGLYYVYVNSNSGIFVVVPVEANIIGDATENGWNSGTALALKSSSASETIFEGTNIALYDGHGYRYRINNGWHVWNDETLVTLSSMGVAELWPDAIAKSQNDIGFFLENAPHKVDGMYTVQLKYTAATNKWTETKTKTGPLLQNYSDVNVGLFGNAYHLANGDPGNWGDPYEVKSPQKNGNVYTWTWNDVVLIEGNEFVILQNGTWGGMSFLWNGTVARTGTAFSSNKITNEGTNENFHVRTGGTYDITLTIDSATGTKTVNID
jgi:hypothetical protein